MRLLATGGEQEEEEDLVTYGGQDACQVRNIFRELNLSTVRGLLILVFGSSHLI